jgi:tetratricopeptide (TPR) repeat protein
MLKGKRAESLAAYTAAAAGKFTDVQKAHALEHAAAQARGLGQFDAAADLAARIPIDAVKKTALMQGLLDQYKAPKVIEQFGQEEIGAWPFWKAGDGYAARGRAFAIVKAGREAETDLTHALEYTSDSRARESIRLALGNNREVNLKDDVGALSAYREIIDSAKQLGSADEFNAVQAIARILTKQGKFDEALAALQRADVEKLAGVWRGTLLIARGDTLRAAGRKDEALALFKAVSTDETVEPRQRKAAQEKATGQ